MNSKHVVIVGGGFAGIKAAKALGNKKGIRVTHIDRRNHHLFQPLLYQVAMAGLSPADIAMPIRTILSDCENIEVLMGNVTHVNLIDKKVTADFGDVNYDYLILACGSKHSYFGKNQWEEHAPGLKTLEQATEIRRRVLLAFEKAESEKNPEVQKQHLTFVIVGGGPTGVELAGALGEISRFTLKKDFDRIDPSRTRVVLIEAGPRILTSFDESLSKRATEDLEKLGVAVWNSTRVTEVTDHGVQMGAELLKSSTVLWAAGVKPSSLNESLGVELDKIGRVLVGKDLSLSRHPEVFVLGDQANVKNEKGETLPGLAPVAMQEGLCAAKNILSDLNSKPRKNFQYVDKGQMATIGRKKAIAQMGSIKLTGFIAWLAWLLIHIYFLIGFKNRLMVLFQWTWSYLTFKRGARLILYKEWRSTPKP